MDIQDAARQLRYGNSDAARVMSAERWSRDSGSGAFTIGVLLCGLAVALYADHEGGRARAANHLVTPIK